MAKAYLADLFGEIDFDAAEKAQGAPRLDVDVAIGGKCIVGEIKTTTPSNGPDFGGQQKAKFEKDFRRGGLQVHVRNRDRHVQGFMPTVLSGESWRESRDGSWGVTGASQWTYRSEKTVGRVARLCRRQENFPGDWSKRLQ